MNCLKYFIFLQILVIIEGAKILAVFPTPSISHQVAFRHFTQELAKQGHEVLIVTADPAFPNGGAPENLTEIDIHDLMYSLWTTEIKEMKLAQGGSMATHFDVVLDTVNGFAKALFKSGILTKLGSDKYDLLIVEAYHKISLSIAHILNLPVLQISSFGSLYDYETVGAPIHPIIYPEIVSQRIKNLTKYEKIHETFKNVIVKSIVYHYEENFNGFLRRQLDIHVPTLHDLRDKVAVLLLNAQTIWEENRPVPIGLSYVSGVYAWSKLPMTKELKEYLDSSKNGVIYMSFGTNVLPSLLPKDKIEVLLNGLEKLPYDILFKWDQDELPRKLGNVRTGRWFPQIDILAHPNVKLFITQAGLQSTEEAIDAGVPLLGIPFLFDQWANAEKYVRHKIGMKLQIETLSVKKFREAVNTVISDKSYRENIVRFRTLMRDQPHKPLDTAIWWTEYVIKYSGASHLRAPAANMPLVQYYELELLLIVLASIIVITCTVFYILALISKYALLLWNSKINVKKSFRRSE